MPTPTFGVKFSPRPGTPRWLWLGCLTYSIIRPSMPHRKKASRASAKNIKSIIPSVHVLDTSDTSDPHYNDRPSSEESDAGSDNALEVQRAKVEFLHSLHYMSNVLIMVAEVQNRVASFCIYWPCCQMDCVPEIQWHSKGSIHPRFQPKIIC